jgi:hypothetical protein
MRQANECLDAAREIVCPQERSKFISLAASYMELAAQIHDINSNARDPVASAFVFVNRHGQKKLQ